jgi:hypothetical protein
VTVSQPGSTSRTRVPQPLLEVHEHQGPLHTQGMHAAPAQQNHQQCQAGREVEAEINQDGLLSPRAHTLAQHVLKELAVR